MHLSRAIACGTLALSCLVLALLLPGRAGADDVYKWVDAQGNTHFVDSPDKIPAQYREKSEHRKVDAPKGAAGQSDKPSSQDDDPPAQWDEPSAAGNAYSEDDARADREQRCRAVRGADIPACFKACVNPQNRQAKNDCEKARQERREARRAARREEDERQRVEERTRCLQAAVDRTEAALCVQRSLPPPSDEVKTVKP